MTMKQYIREIADRTCLPGRYRKKIIADLRQEFAQGLSQGYSEQELIRRMGDPDDVAAGIYDNYISMEEATRPFVEYKSERELFGMPLLHIVKGRRAFQTRGNTHNNFHSVPTAKGVIAIGRRAKGIIAIGNLCCGVIAIGNISAGLVSISNLGIGLLALGNVGIGLLITLSNLAAGLFAIGNGAVGFCGVGNAVLAQYAMGNEVYGTEVLKVESFRQLTAEMEGFIHRLPSKVEGFFRTAAAIAQHWIWILAIAGVFLLCSCVVGIMIARKMENLRR